MLLALAAILSLGGRTICNLLRVLGVVAPGHPSTYHRVFSRDRWSLARLGRSYVAAVLARFAPTGQILLAGDDTVTEHPGPHVYGKGCHRDPVRSTHSYTAFRWGHKWVVLALLIPVPWATRRWALPLLVALYRPEEENQKQGRRHKTPSQLLGQMIRILMRWFPERNFMVVADGGYATHEFAELAARSKRRLTLVSLFYPNANLVGPTPEYSGKGRPRRKGERLPSPKKVVEGATERQRLKVSWYGGGQRKVETVTGTAHWYKKARPLVELRWVFVHDLTGTHRDSYFFTTDPTMTVQSLIETYTGRWNIELGSVTSQVNSLIASANSTLGGISSTLSGATGNATGVLFAALGQVDGLIGSAEFIEGEIVGEVNGLAGMIAPTLGSVTGELNTALGDISLTLGSVTTELNTLIGTVTAAAGGSSAALNTAISAVSSTLGTVTTQLNGLTGEVNTILVGLPTELAGVTGSLGTVMGDVNTTLGSLTGTVSSLEVSLTSELNTLLGAVTGILGGISL